MEIHLHIQEHKLFHMNNIHTGGVSSLRRGHANLLCIVPILVYVLPKVALERKNTQMYPKR